MNCKEKPQTAAPEQISDANPLIINGEKHFKNLKQLTFGGNNAEAYWSFDSKKLVFQSDFKDWGAIELRDEKSSETNEIKIFGNTKKDTKNKHIINKLLVSYI